MDLKVSEHAGIRHLEGPPDLTLMNTVSDVNLILEACFSERTRSALLYAPNLTAGFFDVSSGEAGAILQKLQQYRIRMAIVCPTGSVRISSRFGEMMIEEKSKGYFGVFESVEAAREWLAP
jgi:hypothetical protein